MRMSGSTRRTAFFVAMALGVLAVAISAGYFAVTSAAPASVSTASITAGAIPQVYQRSAVYKLTVNGVPIPVIHYKNYHYVQFTMGSGESKASLSKVDGANLGAVLVSPSQLGYQAVVKGNVATFTMTKPDYLIVEPAGQPQLVLLAEPPENDRPPSKGDGVFNVTDYLADVTGRTPSTSALQSALNDAAQFGNAKRQGVVYVPDGVYSVGNLAIGSNTALYLEPGAVLRVIADKGSYRIDARKATQGDLTWWITTTIGSSNIRMYGRGTLDANGAAAKAAGFFVNAVVPMATTNFVFEGLTVRDGSSWTVIPLRSDNVALRNFKVLNRLDMGENDAVDIVESQNVIVSHGIGISLDDPFSTKSFTSTAGEITVNWPGTPEQVNNVMFDRLLAWTRCYAFKVGQGVGTDQRNVTFANSVVYDAAVGLGIHHKAYAAAVRDVRFSNIDIQRVSKKNDDNRTWIALMVDNGSGTGTGPVSRVSVDHINVRDKGTTGARITGFSDTSNISEVVFRSIRMPGFDRYANTFAELDVTRTKFSSEVRVIGQ